MLSPESTRFGVYHYAVDDDTFVFDPENARNARGRSQFYSCDQDQWRVFQTTVVFTQLSEVVDSESIRRACDAYEAFRGREEAERIRNEREREELLERGRLQAEDWFRRQEEARAEGALDRRVQALNEARVARGGWPRGEYRVRSERLQVRQTHCYACKQRLSSRVSLEHTTCGWILCECGACGCGYGAAV